MSNAWGKFMAAAVNSAIRELDMIDDRVTECKGEVLHIQDKCE